MNDYGIRPRTLFYLNREEGVEPRNNDLYNPNTYLYGNTGLDRTSDDEELGKTHGKSTLAWNFTTVGKIDIRLFYINLKPESWTRCRWAPHDTNIPKFWRISWVTGRQICYSTEALKFA